MNSFKTEAIVIKKRNFLEKDRILTLFSKDEGKIEVLVKGARRPGSKLSYISDIGSVCIFHIHKGKSLDIVTEAQTIFLPSEISGIFSKTNKIGYIFKIINKVYQEGDPHPHTFEAIKKIIQSISDKELDLAMPILLSMVIKDLGITPSFTHCPICEQGICADQKICFEPNRGVGHIHCMNSSCQISSDSLKLTKVLFSQSVDFSTRIKADPKTVAEVYKFLNEYFEWEFGKILPKEVI